MFWRYLFFSFLLGVPSSRIFTSASVPADSGTGVNNEQSLIDSIISHLASHENTDGTIAASKKDETVVAPAVVESAPANTAEVNSAKDDQSSSSQEAGESEESQQIVHAAPGKASALQAGHKQKDEGTFDTEDTQFVTVVTIVTGVCLVGLLMAGVCYYKFRKSSKAASDVEYPAYGVTGPMKERVPSPGDRKLAQSAQMYHYQHQKQQMIAMEKANGDMKHDASDDDSEEDNVEGDYTVYECPGLAPTGEMEVKNPLFRGDETPVTPNQEQPNSQPGSPSGEEH